MVNNSLLLELSRPSFGLALIKVSGYNPIAIAEITIKVHVDFLEYLKNRVLIDDVLLVDTTVIMLSVVCGFLHKHIYKKELDSFKLHVDTYSFIEATYCEGVIPECFLNERLNEDLELKPQS